MCQVSTEQIRLWRKHYEVVLSVEYMFEQLHAHNSPYRHSVDVIPFLSTSEEYQSYGVRIKQLNPLLWDKQISRGETLLYSG